MKKSNVQLEARLYLFPEKMEEEPLLFWKLQRSLQKVTADIQNMFRINKKLSFSQKLGFYVQRRN